MILLLTFDYIHQSFIKVCICTDVYQIVANISFQIAPKIHFLFT